jgi:transcriptional regulator with XRE-family HTH domain
MASATDTPVLGPSLTRLRHRAALTEKTLASEVGVTRRTIIRWEKSLSLPPAAAIRNGHGNGPLAIALGVGWRSLAAALEQDQTSRRRARLLDLPWPPPVEEAE